MPETLPSKYDLSNVEVGDQKYNYINPVKDQGANCQSCSAFAVVAAIEGTFRKKLNCPANSPGGWKLPELSALYLFLYAAPDTWQRRYRDGSNPLLLLQYAKGNGIIPNFCFPYDADSFDPAGSIELPVTSQYASMVTKINDFSKKDGRENIKNSSDRSKYSDSLKNAHANAYGLAYTHYLCCIGYDDNKQIGDKTGAWLCRDSRGRTESPDGNHWIPYGSIDTESMWCVDVGDEMYYEPNFIQSNPDAKGAYILTRQCLDDDGSKRKNFWGCPDIIVRNSKSSNPLSDFPDPKTDYNKRPIENQINYIYVRGKNLTNVMVSDNVSLFYKHGALVADTEDWIPIPVDGTNPQEYSVRLYNIADDYGRKMMEPGQFGLGFACFKWKAPALGADNHYCLLSVVGPSDFVPEHLPTANKRIEFINSHLNIGWRNVDLININKVAANFAANRLGSDGEEMPTVRVPVNLKADHPMHLYLQLECKDVPKGCKVGFRCDVPGPEPQLTLKTTVKHSDYFEVGVISRVPAVFNADVFIELWSEGKILPSGAEVSLAAYHVLQPDDPILAKYGREIPGKGRFKGVLIGGYSVRQE